MNIRELFLSSRLSGIGGGGGSGGGSSSGGGAELNIAYGDTAPQDTSKLWVKTDEPSGVAVSTTLREETIYGISTLNTTLPTGLSSFARASVGTKVYLLGGHNGSGAVDTIMVFDTLTQTLSTLTTKLPTKKYSMGFALVGTKVYLLGGNSSKNICVFDTTTESISTLSVTLPANLMGISNSAALVGTKVYLFGGYSGGTVNTIIAFDTTTETVTTLGTTLPSNGYYTASPVGTKVYLFGNERKTIYVFDTETQSISALQGVEFPKESSSISPVVVGTKIYLFGGSGTIKLTTINVFDTEKQTITTLSTALPQGLYDIGAVLVGTKVYLFGGNPGGFPVNTINVFSISFALEQNQLLMVASTTKNIFDLLPNISIGVDKVYKGNANNEGERVEAALYQNDTWTTI